MQKVSGNKTFPSFVDVEGRTNNVATRCPTLGFHAAVAAAVAGAANASLTAVAHSIFFVFFVSIHTTSAPSTTGTHTDGGAAIR